MGCCLSSDHSQRKYRVIPFDLADLDEEYVVVGQDGDTDEDVGQKRSFGDFRVGGNNLVPDVPKGTSSSFLALPSDPGPILYQAETDHGHAYRSLRPIALATCVTALCNPYMYFSGACCSCDEMCCWLRKEYSTRNVYYVYSNRVVYNRSRLSFPFGPLGCERWNHDTIVTHPFDRGTYGFSVVKAGTLNHCCCFWPIFGGVVARHTVYCNGSPWNRMFTDCNGWWCDEWLCLICCNCCAYQYNGIANPDEVAFASSLALQAHMEGRRFTRSDMEKCLQFWKENISEQTDPIGRKRPVCCEEYCTIPCPSCVCCYRCIHPKRSIPFKKEEAITQELTEVYNQYEKERVKQVESYQDFHGPVRNSTVCRSMGCRRVFGRKGFIFCTEGCCQHNYHCRYKNRNEPAPPFAQHDFDDDWDASSVLFHVLGPPPENVVIRRWKWDEDKNEDVLWTYPLSAPDVASKSKGKEEKAANDDGTTPVISVEKSAKKAAD